MISLFGKSVGRLSFFGQGAGKYPTGNSLAQDVIDISLGDTKLEYAPTDLKIDNSLFKRKYYVRTSYQGALDFCDKVETIGNDRYIITKEISVSKMHEIANTILKEDTHAFFAGIEE
jgi:homoserine dehydrogenase